MYTLVSEVHVCINVILMVQLPSSPAQSIKHQTGWGSSPTVGKNVSFCILSLSTHSWKVNCSHTYEIKHDVHTRYIGA